MRYGAALSFFALSGILIIGYFCFLSLLPVNSNVSGTIQESNYNFITGLSINDSGILVSVVAFIIFMAGILAALFEYKRKRRYKHY